MKGKQILSKYLKASCVDKTMNLLQQHGAVLNVSKARTTKLGDYRPPSNRLPHRISVNQNLNQHEFLLTLIHELAHLECWAKYQKKVKPHGNEWRLIFKELVNYFSEPGIFPEDIQQALAFYFHPQISYRIGNDELKRVLSKYDPVSKFMAIEELLDGTTFAYRRRTFRKLYKLRKNYKCICLNNNRLYLFSPIAKVLPLNAS